MKNMTELKSQQTLSALNNDGQFKAIKSERDKSCNFLSLEIFFKMWKRQGWTLFEKSNFQPFQSSFRKKDNNNAGSVDYITNSSSKSRTKRVMVDANAMWLDQMLNEVIILSQLILSGVNMKIILLHSLLTRLLYIGRLYLVLIRLLYIWNNCLIVRKVLYFILTS